MDTKGAVRKVRQWPVVNAFLRKILKSLGSNSKVVRHLQGKWPVAGVISVQLYKAKFKFYAKCDDHIANNLYYQGAYENAELQFAISLFKHVNTMVDVGANTGLYTILGASINPELRVFSFEPYPVNFARLEQNVRLNALPHVKLEALALGDQRGEAAFFVPVDDNISDVSSFSKNFSESIYQTAFRPVPVKVTTLDSYVLEHKTGKVDFIKIDVEGFELEVFRGALKTLGNDAPVIMCEVFSSYCSTREAFEAQNPKVHALQNLLSALNYHIYLLTSRGLVYLPSFNHAHSDRNYIFSRRSVTGEVTPVPVFIKQIFNAG